MTIRTITVDVDVDLADFDDDDITQEAERRTGISSGSGVSEAIDEMFYAFKLGCQDRAIELAKRIAQDHTGRII